MNSLSPSDRHPSHMLSGPLTTDPAVIGIIGAGHLGRALALAHRQAGYPNSRILISHGSSQQTLEAINRSGLGRNVTSNEEIFQKASLIFIAIRPQSLISLSRLPVSPSTIVISCMAGISTWTLQNLWNIPVHRMMPSGPETVLAGKSIAGLYPGSLVIRDHLTKIGLEVIVVSDEEQMHDITAGVCFPAALLVAKDQNLDIENEIRAGEGFGHLYSRVLSWACTVAPQELSGPERTAYISRMSTPGGITETVCRSIREGNSLYQAYLDGISRCRDIGEEMAGRTISDR
ncbi:MAG: NAD(P)-binding domain-containing protein [Methanospirillum sp.]|uniref:pyrroline-5-carboxylate reductase family protein n=1 Tax=Methanospirillum sp. TaxID=45200 RepID=UPI00237528EB|nr:NAD(P)-binding domain-containing protein [Methanospirillum sp.]MDD1729769.1 NAD(P)-binding domain-containing protein [Methanospirillum sp.]